MLRGPPPSAGSRVLATLPGWLPASSEAYYSLYLPPEWNATGPSIPVVVELAGNGPYTSAYGDISTGHPEGSSLGWGLTAGRGAIWVCMPMLTAGGEFDETYWWGCPPAPNGMFSTEAPQTYTPHRNRCDVNATNTSRAVEYIAAVTRHIIAAYRGDPKRVVIAGFSRCAIGVNYLGLADDDVASLWAGSIAYAHYDGQPGDTNWSYPEPGLPASYERLRRLGSRPQFVCAERNGTAVTTKPYIAAAGFPVNATYTSTGFCNHNDQWTLRPSPARDLLRAWFQGVVGPNPSAEPTLE